VIYERLLGQGYEGGLTAVKVYISGHRDLVPAKRRAVAPQGSRGQRFRTGPGEAYQMDWGFVTVVGPGGTEYRIACFAMVCHHCGSFYVEFFPNARQENLLIGMLHAFMAMGVPDEVLTDNMKSVVTGRDLDGRPVWQRDYAAFMGCVGFRTRLCRPRHPFTKGKVERLIRFVKGNFLAGRDFTDITTLNGEALLWCAEQAGRWRRAVACVPSEEHASACLPAARPLEVTDGVALWLCPSRRITFDGFVSYEGRRFGVPYWYERRDCRVSREGGYLHIYSDDLALELAVHAVTWDRRDSWCEGQWADAQPEELPSQPVTTSISQVELAPGKPAFAKFDFGRWA
jgi:transposase